VRNSRRTRYRQVKQGESTFGRFFMASLPDPGLHCLSSLGLMGVNADPELACITTEPVSTASARSMHKSCQETELSPVPAFISGLRSQVSPRARESVNFRFPDHQVFGALRLSDDYNGEPLESNRTSALLVGQAKRARCPAIAGGV
jgi:hypothetical protein